MSYELNKYFTAYYEDEEELLKGIKQMKAEGLQIGDVLTPFPVHGIEKALGMKSSRLGIVAFAGGAVGAILAFIFQAWVFTIDYPLNFGGKPYLSVPSFIPITFEMTVLFAAFSMVGAFFAVNKLSPLAQPVIHDEKITDDRFLVIVKIDDHATRDTVKQTELLIASTGAVEIKLKTTGNTFTHDYKADGIDETEEIELRNLGT